MKKCIHKKYLLCKTGTAQLFHDDLIVDKEILVPA